MSGKQLRSIQRDEAATVGIGTMIVFIATVLVAAIAAGVIIKTSSDLQQKSQETGREATQQVASNVDVIQIIGKRDGPAEAALADLEIYVTLSPGAVDVDLSEARIMLTNVTTMTILNYASGGPTATAFGAAAQRDADSSFSAANPVISSGDLVVIQMELDTIGMSIEPRDTLEIRIVPEVGESVQKTIRTSGSYGTSTVLVLG